MPIIKFESCPECGMSAWHEQVCYGLSGQTRWVCRQCGNRREGHRLRIDNDDSGLVGKVQSKLFSCSVIIKDISQRGAKLKLVEDDSPSLQLNDIILFNPMLQPFGKLGSYVEAMVRWVSGRDFGVLFKKPLFNSDDEVVRVIRRA